MGVIVWGIGSSRNLYVLPSVFLWVVQPPLSSGEHLTDVAAITDYYNNSITYVFL